MSTSSKLPSKLKLKLYSFTNLESSSSSLVDVEAADGFLFLVLPPSRDSSPELSSSSGKGYWHQTFTIIVARW